MISVVTLVALTSAYGAPNRGSDLDARAIGLGARVTLRNLGVAVAPVVDPTAVCRASTLLPANHTPRLADPVVEAALVVARGC